jgi:hypothetical protein
VATNFEDADGIVALPLVDNPVCGGLVLPHTLRLVVAEECSTKVDLIELPTCAILEAILWHIGVLKGCATHLLGPGQAAQNQRNDGVVVV